MGREERRFGCVDRGGLRRVFKTCIKNELEIKKGERNLTRGMRTIRKGGEEPGELSVQEKNFHKLSNELITPAN